jgi:soluble cytochrome b562
LPQEKLTYAANFETALAQLLSDTPKTNPKDTETKKPDSSNGTQITGVPQSTDKLIKLAAQTFDDYQRLTSEGKLGEAGQKLDELKRILGELQKH